MAKNKTKQNRQCKVEVEVEVEVPFSNQIYLCRSKVNLLVTCLPSQKTMIGETLWICVFFANNFVDLYSCSSGLMNSFALAYRCCFSQLWSNIEEVKLGVSDNGQKSTYRKTTSYPRVNNECKCK